MDIELPNMRKSLRLEKAQVAIELASVSILLVIFAVLAVDMIVVVTGVGILDSAARDAARAAAQSNNPVDSLSRAIRAAQSHITDGYIVGPISVCNNSAVYPPTGRYISDFLFVAPTTVASFTGSPYVAVTSRCQIRTPLPINFYGAKVTNVSYSYMRTYVYPILGITFNNITSAAAPPPNVPAPEAPPPSAQPPSAQPEAQPPNAQPEAQPPNAQPEAQPPNAQPEAPPPNPQPEAQPPNAQPEAQPPNAQPEAPPVPPPAPSVAPVPETAPPPPPDEGI
jgi:hypothetical protein